MSIPGFNRIISILASAVTSGSVNLGLQAYNLVRSLLPGFVQSEISAIYQRAAGGIRAAFLAADDPSRPVNLNQIPIDRELRINSPDGNRIGYKVTVRASRTDTGELVRRGFIVGSDEKLSYDDVALIVESLKDEYFKETRPAGRSEPLSVDVVDIQIDWIARRY